MRHKHPEESLGSLCEVFGVTRQAYYDAAEHEKKTSIAHMLVLMVNRVLRDWHVAGCAVAVVEKNKVIYAKGFGYRNLDNKLPVTPNTVFSIASCTKAFTARLIGTLVTNGTLNINQRCTIITPNLFLTMSY